MLLGGRGIDGGPWGGVDVCSVCVWVPSEQRLRFFVAIFFAARPRPHTVCAVPLKHYDYVSCLCCATNMNRDIHAVFALALGLSVTPYRAAPCPTTEITTLCCLQAQRENQGQLGISQLIHETHTHTHTHMRERYTDRQTHV